MAFLIFFNSSLAVQSEIWKYVSSWPVCQTEFHIEIIKNITRHFKGLCTYVHNLSDLPFRQKFKATFVKQKIIFDELNKSNRNR